MTTALLPTFGARPLPGRTEFTVWAPAAGSVELALEPFGRPVRTAPLSAVGNGVWSVTVTGASAGDRYRFRMDDQPFWPDPASRSQPDGVHGASAIVDPSTFTWTDQTWTGHDLRDLVVYELHVGTFTEAGTFAGVTEKLSYLRDLGITAIELMPLAEFPGRWNWGYDGAALFAPAHQYGGPDGLRRLIDRAHAVGLSVLIDVVYNHLGPDGAYLAAFAPGVLQADRKSPWGGGLDLEPTTGAMLRQFFTANAVHWVREYHADGLRLDATHAIVELGTPTFAADLADAVRAAVPDRHPLVIAEDARNLAEIVRTRRDGGWGLDAVWSDDFHHQMHVRTTGERDGYFEDFRGTTTDIARTIADGWFYQGEYAPHFRGPRGTPTAGTPRERFVVFLQNHDQIGNRARGDRLHHQVDLKSFAAATVLLLVLPETPLLFMGQEWAASTPFQFFTDHEEPLGSQVVEGRREEFRTFAAFSGSNPAVSVPSPQDPSTFERSVLRWDEAGGGPHRGLLELHRELLRIRRMMRDRDVRFASAQAPDEHTIVVRHEDRSGHGGYVTTVRLTTPAWATIEENAGGAGRRVILDTSRVPGLGTRPADDIRPKTPRYEDGGAAS
jgi:maltooligosyltrehalose trehalohydrolase